MNLPRLTQLRKHGLLCIALAAACSPVSQALAETAASSNRAGTSKAAAQKVSDDSSENGSELWSQNCGRCHNKRSPEKFSDSQWDVIVRHMRVRANLTGQEERAIVEFLKSAN
ncbi:MAG: cytochrome c [Bdellovibrionota bacterium]